ncbi:MAG: exonuclease subunit SbcD, partial [Acidimicrobiia bacterium]|nr:exonuclease subunit SbcD [Acidimicrobiia bacterium]
MKALHTSDWHVGRTIRGRSRAGEHRAVLTEIVEQAASNAVDLVLVAGDLFDSATPTPEAEQIVYRTLIDLAEVAPVVAVAGNHDNPRRFDALQPLLAMGRVTAVSEVRPPDAGGVLEFPDIETRVVPIPWTSQRAIVSADDLIARDRDDNAVAYIDRMRRVIAALCAEMDTAAVNLVVGHVMMHGDASGSERVAHTVFEYSLPAQVFPGHLSYVALGHLHRPQRVPASAPVHYSGSPLQLDFGEAGEDKTSLLIEADPGRPAKVTPLPLTAGWRLLVLEGTLDDVMAAAEECAGHHVKVVLHENPRVGLADEVRSHIPGVVDVALARTEAEDRTPPVARMGRDPHELFA